VTAGSPESPDKLTVTIIDMSESPITILGGCGASWLHYPYLLSGKVELPNYDIALLRNG
jgi:hypothetical protein